MRIACSVGIATLAILVCNAHVASAQLVQESIGSRALGMGGAFVAVADDPSAVYWNPAGLATAGPGGAVIGWSQFRTGDQTTLPTSSGPTSRTAFATSLGSLPVGIAYAKFHESALVRSANGTLTTETLDTGQYTVTLLQTVAPGIVVGGNLKYLNATLTTALPGGATTGDSLDLGTTSGANSSGAFDLDVGVMASSPHLRIGFVMKNLRQPTFTPAAGSATSDPVTLQRTARVGVAVLTGRGPTLAMDVDLVTVDLMDGSRRMIAFGGEQRLGKKLEARGGVRWSLIGNRYPVGTAGASVMLHSNLWLDANYTRGALLGDRGYGVAMRVGY